MQIAQLTGFSLSIYDDMIDVYIPFFGNFMYSGIWYMKIKKIKYLLSINLN